MTAHSESSGSQLDDIGLTTIDGAETTFGVYANGVVLAVNVASRCGFTPQYEKLERLHQRYGAAGLTVLGFPSNQFMQELGSADAIKEFCTLTYGVTFPIMEKTRVNGRSAHPLFRALSSVPDDAGEAGRVKWNFEKFVIAPAGKIRRFRSSTEPDAPEVIDAIEAGLNRAG